MMFWEWSPPFPVQPYNPQNHNEMKIQSGADYDPQAAAMHWPPHAANAILTPGGPILTRDVVLKNILTLALARVSHMCYIYFG